jgi:hypothetical protein
MDKNYLVHTNFNHNPSTGRLGSNDPNLQNLPNPDRADDKELGALVKGMFWAPEGYTFWARDFTGIEAVLVGYFAHSPKYIRLAKLGVHDYFNAHMLYNQKKIKFEDIPDLKLTDADLKLGFGSLKKKFKQERDKAKRCVHLSNYRGTAHRMFKEYPETFPTIKEATTVQRMYFELFPEINAWHANLCLTVDGSLTEEQAYVPPAGRCGSGFLETPFGVLNNFWDVIEWSEKDGEGDWRYGEDAKRLIAMGPQATASSIMKFSLICMWCGEMNFEAVDFENIPTEPRGIIAETLRLSIHDEILGMCESNYMEHCLRYSQAVMEQPWSQLPIPPAWNMNTPYLSIGTAAKHGPCWGTMIED